MDKYKMVSVKFLEGLAKRVVDNKLTKADHKILISILESGPNVPTELTPDVTKRDLVKELYPDGYSGIDFALPQNFVNTVQERMGFNICPHFVMDCRGIFKLIPITSIGKAMLPVIYRVCFNSEPPE